MEVAEQEKKRRLGRPPLGKQRLVLKLSPAICVAISQTAAYFGNTKSGLVESALADWFQRATNMGTLPLRAGARYATVARFYALEGL
jgi:hypothetical protein